MHPDRAMERRSARRSIPWSNGRSESTPTRQTGVQREEQINSNSPGRCPTGEGVRTPTTGLSRGRRGSSTPSFRPALLAEDQRRTPQRQHSLLGDHAVEPVQQGSRTQASMAGNLGESQTTQSLLPNGNPQGEGLRHPLATSPPKCSQELTTTTPRSRAGHSQHSPRVSARRTHRNRSCLARSLDTRRARSCAR